MTQLTFAGGNVGRRPYSSGLRDLEALARANLGVFTTADAAGCGASREMLYHHSRSGGRWARPYPGVYVLADLPADSRRQLLAALVWGGPDSTLSHRSAAAIHGLDGVDRRQPELWTPRQCAPTGLVAHRGVVPPTDVVRCGPLRVTSLRRTVLDLAADSDDDTLELVIESALRRDRGLELDPAPGLRGRERLRRVLARRPAGAPPTESELETRYLQVIRTANVPPPVRQHRVLDSRGRCLGRLDVCWPDVGLWVELDGRGSHDRPAALLSDRHRQNELANLLQWLPLRFTWDDVVERPGATASFTANAYERRAVR